MRKRTIVAVMCVCLGTAVPTWADPVIVADGSYTVLSGENGEWRLSGSGFSLTGTGLGEMLPFWDCLRCAPGDPVRMDAHLVGALSDPGTAVWLGGTYDRVFWTADLAWHSGIATASAGAIVSSPFTFTGTLIAFRDEARTSPLFSTALSGTGSATVRFFRELDDGAAEVFRVDYDFAAPADPVPEPASVLLLGSGLTALAIRRRRARPRAQANGN